MTNPATPAESWPYDVAENGKDSYALAIAHKRIEVLEAQAMGFWHPISEIPDELKDGRHLMVWFYREWRIVSYFPDGGWIDDISGDWLVGISHYAEITPPHE